MNEEQFITLLATVLHGMDRLVGAAHEIQMRESIDSVEYDYATFDRCIESARGRLSVVRETAALP